MFFLVVVGVSFSHSVKFFLIFPSFDHTNQGQIVKLLYFFYYIIYHNSRKKEGVGKVQKLQITESRSLYIFFIPPSMILQAHEEHMPLCSNHTMYTFQYHVACL